MISARVIFNNSLSSSPERCARGRRTAPYGARWSAAAAFLILVGLFAAAPFKVWCAAPHDEQMRAMLAAKEVLEKQSSKSSAAPGQDSVANSLEAQLRDLDRQVVEAEAAATSETAKAQGVALAELQGRAERLRQLRAVYQRQLDGLERLETMRKAEGQYSNPSGKGGRFNIEKFGVVLYQIWTFEIISISGQSITVNKIIIGLLVLIVGLSIAKRATRLIYQRIFSHMKIEPGAAAALEKIVYYVFNLLVFFFALQMVNIPLTIFAFLGGAIAIAFGFGAQTILNNFISGLIMIVERPVSTGDVVEVDGNLGKVEEIGARCTQIKLPTGIRVLVPNSHMLEKSVINWTLADDLLRMSITVGVAYGSNVREVERLLYQAIKEHPEVLKEPKPIVLFMDFGDNALIFEMNMWVALNAIKDGRAIRSDIRFRIDELFRQANINIAFPQRDLHLDTLKPLEIRMTDSSKKN